jgi:hypothetical protein
LLLDKSEMGSFQAGQGARIVVTDHGNAAEEPGSPELEQGIALFEKRSSLAENSQSSMRLTRSSQCMCEAVDRGARDIMISVGEEMARLVVIAEAGGDAAFDPGEADAVEGAAVGGCQDAEVWQEVGGLGVAAHLGEVVDEVVADAEDETGIAGGVDPAVGFLQDLDDGLRFALLDQHGRLRDEAPTGEMRIPVLGLTAQIEGHGLVEQLERFREAPLRHAEGGLQIQKDRLVAQRISGAPSPRLPPGVRHLEAPLASGEIALHPLGVAEPGPGEALELVDPLLLERLTCWEQVGDMDGQVGEVEGFGGLLWRGLAALADQQLAQAPAHIPPADLEAGKAVLGIKRRELFQELRSLSAGPGEGGFDGTKNEGKGLSLVKLEQPASGCSARGA